MCFAYSKEKRPSNKWKEKKQFNLLDIVPQVMACSQKQCSALILFIYFFCGLTQMDESTLSNDTQISEAGHFAAWLCV
jgi:hypothetical protein